MLILLPSFKFICFLVCASLHTMLQNMEWELRKTRMIIYSATHYNLHMLENFCKS